MATFEGIVLMPCSVGNRNIKTTAANRLNQITSSAIFNDSNMNTKNGAITEAVKISVYKVNTKSFFSINSEMLVDVIDTKTGVISDIIKISTYKTNIKNFRVIDTEKLVNVINIRAGSRQDATKSCDRKFSCNKMNYFNALLKSYNRIMYYNTSSTILGLIEFGRTNRIKDFYKQDIAGADIKTGMRQVISLSGDTIHDTKKILIGAPREFPLENQWTMNSNSE